MYDMYPEWGPSHLRGDDRATAAVQTAMDRRDSGERPDDN